MLVAGLLAALPAPVALAQSAGDDQYQDPLGGGGNSGGNSQPSTPSQPAQSGGGSSRAAAPSKAPRAPRSVPLARTGVDARIPPAAGLVLLIGGDFPPPTRPH